MKLAIVVVSCMALAGRALAQPTGAEPAATSEPIKAGLYVSFGLALGGMSEEGENGHRITLVHGSLGLQYGAPAGVSYRLGASLDALTAYDQSVAPGIEAQIDHPVSDGLWLGGRGSLGISVNQERGMWTIGARARTSAFGFGVDVLGFGPSGNGARGHAIGMLGFIGLEGRAAKYGLVVGAVAGVIIGGLALAALSNTH